MWWATSFIILMNDSIDTITKPEAFESIIMIFVLRNFSLIVHLKKNIVVFFGIGIVRCRFLYFKRQLPNIWTGGNMLWTKTYNFGKISCFSTIPLMMRFSRIYEMEYISIKIENLCHVQIRRILQFGLTSLLHS